MDGSPVPSTNSPPERRQSNSTPTPGTPNGVIPIGDSPRVMPAPARRVSDIRNMFEVKDGETDRSPVVDATGKTVIASAPSPGRGGAGLILKIRELEEANESLKQSANKLQEQYNNSLKETTSLQEQAGNSNKEIQAYQSRIQDLNQELEAVQAKLVRLKDEYDKELESAKESSKSQAGTYDGKIQELENSLRETNEKFQSKVAEFTVAEETSKQLEKDLKEARDNIAEKETAVTVSETKVTNLQSEVKELQEKIQQNNTTVAAYDDTITKLNDELKDLKARNEELSKYAPKTAPKPAGGAKAGSAGTKPVVPKATPSTAKPGTAAKPAPGIKAVGKSASKSGL